MSSLVLLPLAVFAIIIIVSNLWDEKDLKESGFNQISRAFKDSFSEESLAELKSYLSRKPPDMDMVMFDSGMRIRYSTLKDFALDERIRLTDVLDYISTHLEGYMFQFDRPVPGEDGYLLMRLVAKPFRKRHIFFAMDVLAITLFALLLAASLISILISRSLADSLTRLERHTRVVAEGDLDYVIPPGKGSNEVRSLADSIERMRLRLKDESARRARLVMGISHDLKTPLALIRGYAEAVGDKVFGPEEEARQLELIISRADQLSGMVDELIDYVRMDTGEWRLAVTAVPLAEFMGTWAKSLSADARIYGKEVQVDIRIPEGIRVHLDPRLARRILENLVHNAFRYSGSGACIRVEARMETPSTALVEIQDDGAGIAPEDLPHITDPFYRASGSRREPGMGLGLSIVHTLAESHGWDLRIRSRPGDTAFTLVMPVATDHEDSVKH